MPADQLQSDLASLASVLDPEAEPRRRLDPARALDLARAQVAIIRCRLESGVYQRPRPVRLGVMLDRLAGGPDR